MANHPNRSVTNRPLIAQSFTGSFLVGYRDGTIRVTTAAYPGKSAYWLVGSGDRMRRVEVMENRSHCYSWARNEAQMATDFARLLRGEVVDGGRDALENAMVEKWGITRDAIRLI